MGPGFVPHHMTDTEDESAREQEYECMAVLRDAAIIMRDLYKRNHGSSRDLDEVTAFLDSYVIAETAALLSESE